MKDSQIKNKQDSFFLIFFSNILYFKSIKKIYYDPIFFDKKQFCDLRIRVFESHKNNKFINGSILLFKSVKTIFFFNFINLSEKNSIQETARLRQFLHQILHRKMFSTKS